MGINRIWACFFGRDSEASPSQRRAVLGEGAFSKLLTRGDDVFDAAYAELAVRTLLFSEYWKELSPSDPVNTYNATRLQVPVPKLELTPPLRTNVLEYGRQSALTLTCTLLNPSAGVYVLGQDRYEADLGGWIGPVRLADLRFLLDTTGTTGNIQLHVNSTPEVRIDIRAVLQAGETRSWSRQDLAEAFSAASAGETRLAALLMDEWLQCQRT